MGWLLHWLAVHTGTVNEAGPYYGFWSGFGSDLGELTIFAAVLGVYHRHNCHTRHCWRIGRHVVDGTPWCNHHHQAARVLAADAQVRGGAGSNPAESRLAADERMAAPPAAPIDVRGQRL